MSDTPQTPDQPVEPVEPDQPTEPQPDEGGDEGQGVGGGVPRLGGYGEGDDDEGATSDTDE